MRAWDIWWPANPRPGRAVVRVVLKVGSGLHDAEDLISHMSVALGTLRAEDRRVLRSYYEGEQDCQATALECGIAPNLVKVRLFRARRRLERAVRRRLTRGETPPAPGVCGLGGEV